MAELPEFLRNFMGYLNNPTSNDPNDYPASAKITDDNCLLLIAKLIRKGEEIERLSMGLNAEIAEHEALRQRLWVMLDNLHPGIRNSDRPYIGYRDWEGDKWFVAWGNRK